MTPSHHGERRRELRNSRIFCISTKNSKLLGAYCVGQKWWSWTCQLVQIHFHSCCLLDWIFIRNFGAEWRIFTGKTPPFSVARWLTSAFIRHVYTLKTPVGLVSVSSRMQSCVMNKLCVCVFLLSEWANSRRKQHESNYSLEIVYVRSFVSTRVCLWRKSLSENIERST